MNRKLAWILVFSLSLAAVAHGQTPAASPTVVNCDAGQSLNSVISKLNKQVPNTVMVQGTCTEYVTITGFENLTVKSSSGATLVQPNTLPNNLFLTLLRIDASRSVLIDGLNILSTPSGIPPVGIGKSSVDVRLRNLKIQGGNPGIIVFENSQVSIAHVTVENPGYAAVGIYDASDVHIELCLFDNSSGTPWHDGLDVGAAHVTMYGTTIRNMQVGLRAGGTAIIDVNFFNTYYSRGGSTDVIIENPAGTNFNGAVIQNGSSLNLGSAKLRITNAGQPWGGNSGGLLISAGSTLNANNNLVISGSQGQGVFVTNDSHASLDGSNVTGSQHGGLVAVNLSSISVGSANPPTQVGGNVVDLFCDSKSMITGGANISNATTVQCTNLLPGDNVPVP
jgi:hypothetical protein